VLPDAQGTAITPAPAWHYSADPALEALISRIRDTYPPQTPAGLEGFRAFLNVLGNPQHHLPPVFHVAGTNGKGSTIAFLQSALEAGGKTVHRFISPHMVRFTERIVIGGREIAPDVLTALVAEIDAAAQSTAAGRGLSFFEFFTALALTAFARYPADAVLVEVGMGGLLDATNVIDSPACAVITRISHDHMRMLGNNVTEIAAQKAGIIKQSCPAVLGPQVDAAVLDVCAAAAARAGAAGLYAAGRDWHVTQTAEGFRFQSAQASFDLPQPALCGDHQVLNAGTAIAALLASPFADVARADILTQAMHNVRWAGRMQRLDTGVLADMLPAGWELWVDGAHNDSGAEIMKTQIARWQAQDAKPLHLLTAFKARKAPDEFYAPLAGLFASTQVVDFDMGAPMEPVHKLAQRLSHAGYADVRVSESLLAALGAILAAIPPVQAAPRFESAAGGRILVAGSLYLVGHALKINGADT
jgi:dihydrofolate synthase/folylpolyglutamate synthase